MRVFMCSKCHEPCFTALLGAKNVTPNSIGCPDIANYTPEWKLVMINGKPLEDE